jgi:hypothetical protein
MADRLIIDAIVLTPAAGALEAHVVRRGRRVQAETGGKESGRQIELRGNLAAMLTPAQNANEVAGKPLSSALPDRRLRQAAESLWCPSVSPEGLITVGRVVWMMLDLYGFHSTIQMLPVVSPRLKNNLSAVSESSQKSGIPAFIIDRRARWEW